MPCFLIKGYTCFKTFCVTSTKYVNFLQRLIQHTDDAHAYVSCWSSRFILGVMSALSHMVFVWFHFKKQNGMKKTPKFRRKKKQKKAKQSN